jgi:hypothetical protein
MRSPGRDSRDERGKGTASTAVAPGGPAECHQGKEGSAKRDGMQSYSVDDVCLFNAHPTWDKNPCSLDFCPTHNCRLRQSRCTTGKNKQRHIL